MRIQVFLKIVFTLTVFSTTLFSQRSSSELQRKQRELQSLRDEIKKYEQRLTDSERREKQTLEHLDDLEHQSNLIKKLIRTLKEEEAVLKIEIDTVKNAINELEKQLQYLKSHYANYVRSVYKNGRMYDIELLFSSNSINQMYIRIQYLKRFSEQRVRDMNAIEAKKLELESKNIELQDKLQREHRLIAEKLREEETLRKRYAERQELLVKIRKDKITYRKQLQRKTTAYKQIEQLIAELIEKERLRKEKEEAERRERERLLASKEQNVKLPTPSLAATGTFSLKYGKLRWPVERGTIHARFGTNIHPILKTVTQNTGIDIATPVGSNVYAVADGEVVAISFIPGFGNVIILTHTDGYRTVYAQLADVLVSEGQKVQEGTIIGKSGDTVDRPLIHFEIWKDREKLDPERWLLTQR
ncbi:MAG: peptidoglycan DD-metalloendopeptidase family protein [Bacteroidetes bacterium]|nr:peptidoglycan DD-metalloendopeptidase family protein [Bacteroidota bacterium]